MEKKFAIQVLEHPICINRIVSVFYSDMSLGFASSGERHDFWEFIYVDRGQIQIETDTQTHTLSQGQIIFHPPMEYHKAYSRRFKNSSICIFSFFCNSPFMNSLASQVFTLSEIQYHALSSALALAGNVFCSLIDTREELYLVREKTADSISEQLLANQIEYFLLLCIQHIQAIKRIDEPSLTTDVITQNRSDLLGQRTVDYLHKHVYQPLSISDLCIEFGCSKTALSTAFHRYTGSSIIPYFNRLKIDEARLLIRSTDYTLTEIADRLHFCNASYFSRAFKRYTGMYPREYAKSIKANSSAHLILKDK